MEFGSGVVAYLLSNLVLEFWLVGWNGDVDLNWGLDWDGEGLTPLVVRGSDLGTDGLNSCPASAPDILLRLFGLVLN